MEAEVHEYDEKGFSLRLEARLKNAALVKAREQLGLTAKAAAEAMGVNYYVYISYEGMRAYPRLEIQKRICDFYRGQGVLILEEEVFPEELGGVRLRKMVVEREIPKSQLLSLTGASHRHLLPPVTLEQELDAQELSEEIGKVLDKLKPREANILRMRYGLEGTEPMKYEEIGATLGITVERTRQIHNRALQKIGSGRIMYGQRVSPPLGRHLEDYLESLSR